MNVPLKEMVTFFLVRKNNSM